MIEQIAGIPAEVDLASEFRYREPILDEDAAWWCRSRQSGETADTLAALREGRSAGARALDLQRVDSTIARESDDVLYTHAGPEIGVASTKAFTTQVVALYLLALKLGRARAPRGRAEKPRVATCALSCACRGWWSRRSSSTQSIRAIAQKYFHATDFLFLGRGIMYPIALEGALKLKEISYIHAEGYAAGEMKHGPIALIDEDMPVVVIANRSPRLRQGGLEPRAGAARDGQVIAVATEGDTALARQGRTT